MVETGTIIMIDAPIWFDPAVDACHTIALPTELNPAPMFQWSTVGIACYTTQLRKYKLFSQWNAPIASLLVNTNTSSFKWQELNQQLPISMKLWSHY